MRTDVEEEFNKLSNKKLSLVESLEQVCDSPRLQIERGRSRTGLTALLPFVGELKHSGQNQWREAAEGTDQETGWAAGAWSAGKYCHLSLFTHNTKMMDYWLTDWLIDDK